MIINLKQSKLFTIDPDTRFSHEYNLPKGVWSEIWRRYKFLEYTPSELKAYYEIKTGRKAGANLLSRWIWRADVYWRAQIAIEKGAHCVNSSFFGDNEWLVIKELLKNIKVSVKQDVKTLL